MVGRELLFSTSRRWVAHPGHSDGRDRPGRTKVAWSFASTAARVCAWNCTSRVHRQIEAIRAWQSRRWRQSTPYPRSSMHQPVSSPIPCRDQRSWAGSHGWEVG